MPGPYDQRVPQPPIWTGSVTAGRHYDTPDATFARRRGSRHRCAPTRTDTLMRPEVEAPGPVESVVVVGGVSACSDAGEAGQGARILPGTKHRRLVGDEGSGGRARFWFADVDVSDT